MTLKFANSLEKEATFHSLLNEHAAQQLLETCIFVTGKGLFLHAQLVNLFFSLFCIKTVV